ncbi:MAG: PQQ-dependent sugar dehydrogenase [Planctomycetia bacterium]|nr:PQQ-dependent sugar dehydrogenase [Planctomycetia bacterium]
MSEDSPIRNRWRFRLLRGGALLLLVIAAALAGWFGYRQATAVAAMKRLGSSKVIGTPEPPPGFRLARIGSPRLKEPVHLTVSPDRNSLWIVERRGRILSWAAPYPDHEPQVLGELDGELASLAFHPQFETNGRVFVTLRSASPATASVVELAYDSEHFRLQTSNRRIILSWPAMDHIGGAVTFGKDGYLYVSVGDGGDSTGEGPSYLTGQDLSDWLGGILRVDVDRRDDGLEYAVPADNPFVGKENCRPEVWAYGLRNPWKLTVDAVDGRLWVSDVGEDLWEAIYVVGPGDNCGWPLDEGSHPFRADGARGPTPIVPPVVEHPHSEMRAIVGGPCVVDSKFPELSGTYLYGDHTTGVLCAARYDLAREQCTSLLLAKSGIAITSIAADRAGDILVCSLEGELCRLEPISAPLATAPFPRRLSETGLFTSTTEYQTAADLVPYDVNSPLYSDGAAKLRHIYLPPEKGIDFYVRQPWRFPAGTTFVKTFTLNSPGGHGATRRVETRLLQFEDGQWNGYSYQWNDEQTDAQLVDAAGATVSYQVAVDDGGVRSQDWRFPSRSECSMCHTPGGGMVLGFNTAQLNRPASWKGRKHHQIELFESLGLFNSPLPRTSRFKGLIVSSAAHTWPRLAEPANVSEPLDRRARSYLHANCAHCHTFLGGGNSPIRLNYDVPLAETRVLDERPVHGHWGLADPRIVVPGEPNRSLLAHRIKTLNRERMPRVGSAVVDREGARLIDDWISSLPLKVNDQSPAPQ